MPLARLDYANIRNSKAIRISLNCAFTTLILKISAMGSKSFAKLAGLLSVLSVVSAADVFINLPILNANVAPDGFSRSAIVAGAGIPGTVITANKGDVLHINVTNQLTDPTMRRSTSIVGVQRRLEIRTT